MRPDLRVRLELWLPLYFAAVATLPLFRPGAYLLESALSLNLLLVFVLSWDVFCGPSRETNFGHSFFIGGGAYLSAWLQVERGASPWLCALVALLACTGAGVGLGWVADRFRGPSFALATMAFQLMLFQAVFLFPAVFGAEEGISGVAPFVRSRLGSYYLVAAAAASVALLRGLLLRSRLGLLLTAAGEDEELARSSGLRTRRLKVAVFSLSAALGGLGGLLYAHTQSQVNAELVSSGLSVQIVLLGLIGGAGTGPAASVVGFFLLRQAMAGVVPGEGVVYGIALLAAVVLFPGGLVARVGAR